LAGRGDIFRIPLSGIGGDAGEKSADGLVVIVEAPVIENGVVGKSS